MTGKVYFVSAPGRIKIGYTRKPEIRLAQLRAVDMEPLETLGVIVGSRLLETKLHASLREYAIRGEWFIDCPAVRKVVDDALAGKFAGFAEPDVSIITAAPRAHERLDPFIAINASLAKCRSLGDEIERRARAGEDIKDLVSFAVFLAEEIIAATLYPKTVAEVAA